LLERLATGQSLQLCDGGEVAMSYVHPNDIALAIDRVVGNRATFRQAYNLVHPAAFFASDYYSEIARQLGVRLSIEDVPMSRVWAEMKGWEMTTLPHVYDATKLLSDTGYVPETTLPTAIADAIRCPPSSPAEIASIPVHQRMNKPPRPNRIEWAIEGTKRVSAELVRARTPKSPLAQASPAAAATEP
jgi:hypothetical protein